MKTIIRAIAVAAVVFYALCWFSNQPTKVLHNIGIALPWLSLFLAIPVAYACKVEDNNFIPAWGYVYAASTVLYVVTVSILSGSVWQQLPHLAACVSFVACFSLEHKQ